LPHVASTALDAVLDRRETHRLFDRARPLTLETVAQVLARSFGATGAAALGGGLSALRKRSPSGGGMHPVEAYPLIVDVEGVAPGWYHYRACDHRLAPLRALSREDARASIGALAAGQEYFASAPLLVALTLRFPRHHWKYPQHARAYRVMLLEAGHLSQTFYLAATDAGLGAFITAAINDADVDAALGLDGVEEGCIALLGCGHPAAEGDALRLSRYLGPD
jgi:putative peptide maturation dehydrogenase